jgi:hypothetical protein
MAQIGSPFDFYGDYYGGTYEGILKKFKEDIKLQQLYLLGKEKLDKNFDVNDPNTNDIEKMGYEYFLNNLIKARQTLQDRITKKTISNEEKQMLLKNYNDLFGFVLEQRDEPIPSKSWNFGTNKRKLQKLTRDYFKLKNFIKKQRKTPLPQPERERALPPIPENSYLSSYFNSGDDLYTLAVPDDSIYSNPNAMENFTESVKPSQGPRFAFV